jgi:hypothetical protein
MKILLWQRLVSGCLAECTLATGGKISCIQGYFQKKGLDDILLPSMQLSIVAAAPIMER